MPIFEYACRGCGHRFEQLVRGSTKPVCPSCGGRKVAKQLSVFAVSAAAEAPCGHPASACESCGIPGGPDRCHPA